MSTNSTTNATHGEEHGHEHVHDLRDDYGSKLGMWLFLFTELILFGGLFLLYMAYRYQYFPEFQLSAKSLKIWMGGLNTIILLTSSLTMVLSIVALQRRKIKASIYWLITTIVFAFGFLVVKYFEWSDKFAHGIFPGGEELALKSQGEKVFYGLYFTMTGLHGLHVIIGMIILGFILVFIVKGKVSPDRFALIENGGLYWHLVDLIWIFLFPLFYLLH
ncbi:MAG: cytochrome c oxidase subunit 3 family protein [Candidatus Kapabacteria bacterium]|nr:cytochrome c oxidase subunit 3 family protein [Candidatus Kapabacteria bacterium]